MLRAWMSARVWAKLSMEADHRRPLRVERLVSLLAGDDEIVDGAIALPLEPFLRAGLRAGPDDSPEVMCRCKVSERLAVKHDIAKEAFLEMLLEIGRKFGVADDEVAGRIEQARAIDHTVGRIVELSGHHEDSFRCPGQPVSCLRCKARQNAKAQRHIIDPRRRQRRVDPVCHLDAHSGHHQAEIDSHRLAKPVNPRTKIEREGHHQQRVDQAHHHYDPQQGAIAPAARPGRHRVENVDEILAAADREDLEHRAPPLPRPTSAPGH